MPVILTTAPTSYPITLTDLKDHLRETGTDNDTIILNTLKAATSEAENYTWRKFVTQTWTYYSNGFAHKFELPFGQLQSVTSIKYYDADNVLQTLDASVYDVDTLSDPGVIRLAYGQSWPTVYDRSNAIRIEFVCGYTVIPESIKNAIKLKSEMIYGNLFDSEINGIVRAYESALNPYRLVV